MKKSNDIREVGTSLANGAGRDHGVGYRAAETGCRLPSHWSHVFITSFKRSKVEVCEDSGAWGTERDERHTATCTRLAKTGSHWNEIEQRRIV